MVAEQLGELVSIPEAATRLGISVEAVRKRLQRGRLTATASPTGTLVELPPDFLTLERRLDTTGQAVAIVPTESETVQTLSERIGRLTAELAEARRNERAALRSLMRLSRADSDS